MLGHLLLYGTVALLTSHNPISRATLKLIAIICFPQGSLEKSGKLYFSQHHLSLINLDCWNSSKRRSFKEFRRSWKIEEAISVILVLSFVFSEKEVKTL